MSREHDITFTFRVSGKKKNGETRQKTFVKINHALRYLWRIKEAREIYLEEVHKDGNVATLFAKVGRRRAINSNYALLPEGRPEATCGSAWKLLPSKFNELE